MLKMLCSLIDCLIKNRQKLTLIVDRHSNTHFFSVMTYLKKKQLNKYICFSTNPSVDIGSCCVVTYIKRINITGVNLTSSNVT